ncbi:MAG: 23S rRNA (guanine(2445)-N(2))/(guanine(2069)-N(7))-methyltransferase [Spirochaeta sp. LUC14_002_19_P3]|nr:MAG: 23S rRNA (guanine(2445)-N(2))/(guanine(2069)-N(7))-methyltransferase [Spirochaeta sp. LUC14_002_19_P3]
MIFFAPCPPGAEVLLREELTEFGAGDISSAPQGAGFSGNLRTAYHLSLNLRFASRLLMELARADAPDTEALYQLALTIPWEDYFPTERSISCRVTGVPRDKDPRFAALRLKDAIADRFIKNRGARPSVDKRNPDVRIEARWNGREAIIYLNWSGPPLHERGYRLDHSDTVLRETTAAAVLGLSGWKNIAAEGGGFADPVCGSGTLLAEAAMMAMNAPVGVHRKCWGFSPLAMHDETLWQSILNQERIRYGEALERLPIIMGFDVNPGAVRMSRANLRRAGLHSAVRLEVHDIRTGRPKLWPKGARGLICADPPYGHRGEEAPEPVYKAIGEVFRGLEEGWRLALLAPDRKTAAASFLKPEKIYPAVSGGMDLVLGLYERYGRDAGGTETAAFGEKSRPGEKQKPVAEGSEEPGGSGVSKKTYKTADAASGRDSQPGEKRQSEGYEGTGGSGVSKKTDIQMDVRVDALRKQLGRNLDSLRKWAEKCGVSSYRIWDTDLPEFNAAVDWYEGRWLHVQEFDAPGKIPRETSQCRFETLLAVLKELTGCADEDVFVKTRRRGVRPYPNRRGGTERMIIRENQVRFLVNFTDYLDTGIFLDHRPTRALIRGWAAGGTFLNLFAYTGTATVMAALGGANSTISVDVSNTYLRWCRDNLALNRADGPQHKFIRADAVSWLKDTDEHFDLIFIDPPTYSNGSGRDDWFVQEHHGLLLRLAMGRLNPGGMVVFSENFRRFVMDAGLKREFNVQEITRDTLHPDFAMRARSHRCWKILLP